MGETLDYINSCIENGQCDSSGEVFYGADCVSDYECSNCHRHFETEGDTRRHITAQRKKKSHRRVAIWEWHMTDGPDYYYIIKV